MDTAWFAVDSEGHVAKERRRDLVRVGHDGQEAVVEVLVVARARGWRDWRLGLSLAIGLLPVDRVAQADTATAAPVRLEWIRARGAEACLARADIEERVSARLGRPVFSDAARGTIEGFVQREGETWVAHILARDESGRVTGSRDLTNNAPDCSGLDAAVTLAVALVIDPEAALRPPSSAPPRPLPVRLPVAVPPAPPLPPAPPFPTPAAPPPPPPAECPVERPCPRAESVPEARSLPKATLGGRVLVASGLLPGAAAGFAVAAEVPLTRWIDVTTGAFFLPEERTSNSEFGFGLTAAWLGACAVPWRARAPRVTLSLCGDLGLGAIHSVVYAFLPTNPGDRVWAGATASGQLRVRIAGPVALEAGAALVVPLIRQPFVVQGEGTAVFQESSAAAVGFGGVGLSIP